MEGANSIKIVINNFGVYPARDGIVSLNGAKFIDFRSEPALPNTTKITDQNASGIFKMVVLPPRSQTVVRANFDNSSTIKQLIAYVRSNEKVGYHDTVITIIFYLILGFSYVAFFISIFYWKKKYNISEWDILKYLIVVLCYEISFTAFYLYFLAPHHIGIII